MRAGLRAAGVPDPDGSEDEGDVNNRVKGSFCAYSDYEDDGMNDRIP